MNRLELRQLAEDRINDAQCLLAGGRWSGAYYLAGYAVECGLKACVLAHVEATGAIFRDKKYGEKCWTHDLEDLLDLAGLEAAMVGDTTTNKALDVNWTCVRDWSEISRYEQKTEQQARRMCKAITNNPDGVFAWIRPRW